MEDCNEVLLPTWSIEGHAQQYSHLASIVAGKTTIAEYYDELVQESINDVAESPVGFTTSPFRWFLTKNPSTSRSGNETIRKDDTATPLLDLEARLDDPPVMEMERCNRTEKETAVVGIQIRARL